MPSLRSTRATPFLRVPTATTRPTGTVFLTACLAMALLACAPLRATAQEYRIGINDTVDVQVYGQPELSARFTVRADGNVELPLVGAIPAANSTVGQLQTAIQTKLADGFLVNPQVTVKVAEYNSQKVFVMGEVGTPGPVFIKGPLTLLEALSKAGGLAKTAGAEIVVLRAAQVDDGIGPLFPGQNGVTEVGRVALDDLQAGRLSDNIVLKHGDTVFTPKGGVVVVTGEVISPGPIPHARNLTVLQAISLAGGTTRAGSDKRARIIRFVKGEKQELKAKLTDLLEPGDIVRVPSRLF